MIGRWNRLGAANHLYVLILLSLLAGGLLAFALYRMAQPTRHEASDKLFLFCAAGMRYPMERIVEEYQDRYGTMIEVQYGGSNTLLSQLEVGRIGDLYLAADDSYVELAKEKGLAAESIPICRMRPVIVVSKTNDKGIKGLDDLVRDDVTVALANPDAAAIGRTTRVLLQKSGHWEQLEPLVTSKGVFKPTVNDVANDVKLGTVDAGIVWDSTAAQYPELEAITAPELEAGSARVEITVLNSSANPTESLRFARYVAGRNAGLDVFREFGYDVVNGDVWEEYPEITFFAGSVNRRALEPIIKEFEQREGVRVNTVYNGCGILTAQMRAITDTKDGAFPDAYMACDVYYLETVQDLFQPGTDVSDTNIVIAVQKGNPKGIKRLEDLTRPGVRVAVGQPEQCTIGVLTGRLLKAEGLYDKLMENNVVTQTATSALLVPSVTTGAADAALAYETDTLSERDRIDAVPIDSPLAKAVQPYSVALSSDHQYLSQRLFEHIAHSRDVFESRGFHWRLDAAVGQSEQRPETP